MSPAANARGVHSGSPPQAPPLPGASASPRLLLRVRPALGQHHASRVGQDTATALLPRVHVTALRPARGDSDAVRSPLQGPVCPSGVGQGLHSTGDKARLPGVPMSPDPERWDTLRRYVEWEREKHPQPPPPRFWCSLPYLENLSPLPVLFLLKSFENYQK